MNYTMIENNFKSFPNMVRHLGIKWLRKEFDKGYPYHILLVWLSRISIDPLNPNMLDQSAQRALTWIMHVEGCLSLLCKENMQGKRIILEGLKDGGNFSQNLSQLEVAKKMKENGYDISLEDTSVVPKPPIDILATKNKSSLILELVTPDMYLDLKVSGFASYVPDRIRSILLDKLKKQVTKYKDKTNIPIILIFNLTRSPDAGLEYLLYALRGTTVDNFVFNTRSELINRFITFEKDPHFENLEVARRLSAVICYREINTLDNIQLQGDVTLNESATCVLDSDALEDLRSIFSESTDS